MRCDRRRGGRDRRRRRRHARWRLRRRAWRGADRGGLQHGPAGKEEHANRDPTHPCHVTALARAAQSARQVPVRARRRAPRTRPRNVMTHRHFHVRRDGRWPRCQTAGWREQPRSPLRERATEMCPRGRSRKRVRARDDGRARVGTRARACSQRRGQNGSSPEQWSTTLWLFDTQRQCRLRTRHAPWPADSHWKHACARAHVHTLALQLPPGSNRRTSHAPSHRLADHARAPALDDALVAQQNATVQGTVVDESRRRDARRHGDRHRDQHRPPVDRGHRSRTAATGSTTCRPGSYKLRIELPGFATAEISGVELLVGANATVPPIAMKVASARRKPSP